MAVTLEERTQAQISAIELITQLRLAGISDETIAVGMGKFLGGTNPSAQSIQRWRTGKSRPSKVNGFALASFYKAIIAKLEAEKESA